MKLSEIDRFAIGPAMSLVPSRMNSQSAIAMLLAIGLQESRFEYRRQIRGPARGWWQFEVNGVRGVVTHPATRQYATHAMHRLGYRMSEATDLQPVLEHNDHLAAVFARLLLWTLPQRLPSPVEHELAWRQYLDAWRPGKPHERTWKGFFDAGWRYVQTGEEPQ